MTFLPRPQLPQQVIDEALCIGSNEERSRLIICAWFMKDKPLEENARFLMEHYGENGAGFYLDDRPYSVWYNAEGLRVSSGESVQRSATVLSWEDAARRIRELLELGRYMPQSEIDRAPEYEKARLAEDLLYMYRDIDGDNKDAYFLTMKPVYELHGGFPEMSAAVKELLEQPDTLQALVDECRAFIDAYEQDPNILRFRYRPKELLQRLTDLQREPLTFTAAEGYDPQRRFFISGDELDQVLRGSTEYRLPVCLYKLRVKFHILLGKLHRHRWVISVQQLLCLGKQVTVVKQHLEDGVFFEFGGQCGHLFIQHPPDGDIPLPVVSTRKVNDALCLCADDVVVVGCEIDQVLRQLTRGKRVSVQLHGRSVGVENDPAVHKLSHLKNNLSCHFIILLFFVTKYK